MARMKDGASKTAVLIESVESVRSKWYDPQQGFVVGFLPAHFVASAREKTAFATLDSQLVEMQSGMDTPDTYAMIDDARAKFLEAKDTKRSSIALQSMLLWAAVSAGVGFAFFRLKKS